MDAIAGALAGPSPFAFVFVYARGRSGKRSGTARSIVESRDSSTSRMGTRTVNHHEDVIILGDGAAGVAAAHASLRLGVRPLLISLGNGATTLYSGCLDHGVWNLHPRSSSLDERQKEFIDAIDIWCVDPEKTRVATLAGVVRTADAADRALLNLASHKNETILVPRIDRPNWDADFLARSWSEDLWCREQGLRFESFDASSLDDDRMRFGSDTEIAFHLDSPEGRTKFGEHLSAEVQRHGGGKSVLLGPWLGIDTPVASILTNHIGIQIGEACAGLGSTAGARWEHAANRWLTQQRITRIQDRVQRLEQVDGDWNVHVSQSKRPYQAKAVVVATGGIAGGGIILTSGEPQEGNEQSFSPAHPFSLSYRGPLVLTVDGRISETVASLHGFNLERLAWPRDDHGVWWMDRINVLRDGVQVLDASNNPLAGLFVAGELALKRPAASLASIATGVEAGTAAARYVLTNA